MKAVNAKRWKELGKKNARLKRQVADQALDIDMVKEVTEGELLSPTRRRAAVDYLRNLLEVAQRRTCTVVDRR